MVRIVVTVRVRAMCWLTLCLLPRPIHGYRPINELAIHYSVVLLRRGD